MTLQQIHYLLAIDQYRNFVKAARACHITQPTLSMQIQKLEVELGLKIFDRTKQPVEPTNTGKELIVHARKIINATNDLKYFVSNQKGQVDGMLKIGIIPTLAPYLIPIFLSPFTQKYPSIKLHISELKTELIIEKIKTESLDAGILATPLKEQSLIEEKLFYEKFLAYLSKKSPLNRKQFLLPYDIEAKDVWLLEEGHCFTSQVISLCELKKKNNALSNFVYDANNIESLKHLVEINNGITIIPELALHTTYQAEKKRIRNFKPPAPVREVSMVYHRNFLKQNLINALKEEILQALPDDIKINSGENMLQMY